MRADKEKAIKLRISGKSYNQINMLLGVPKSTLSIWLKDIILNDEATSKIKARVHSLSLNKLIERNKLQGQVAASSHQKIKRDAEIEALKFLKDPLFIAGVSLYWGEGYKKGWYQSKWKSIDFANSDPEMIRLMVKFFKQFLKISEKDIKIQIMGHEGSDIEKYITFWQNLTSVPRNNFFKPFLTTSKSSKKKVASKLEYGTIHLRINHIESFYRLYGWTEALKRKII